jgi:hypothetical protein
MSEPTGAAQTGPPGERWHPYMPREGRVERSWRLAGDAWRLVRSDRTIAILALWSAVVVTGSSALVLYFGGYFDDPNRSAGHFAIVGALSAYPITVIAIFFNVALLSAARATMDGAHMSVAGALREAGKRIGKIAVWALLAAGVGLLLDEIASRLPGGGRIAAWLVGAAWSIATIFVVPVLVLEDRGALSAVRRSASLIKERWGEAITGSLTIGFWFAFAAIPICLVFGTGAGMVETSPGAATIFMTLGVAGFVLLSAANVAVRGIFALALFRFATEGTAKTFSEADLKHPFVPGFWQGR